VLPQLIERATRAGVPAAAIGRVGGSRITLSIGGREVVDEPRADLEQIWSSVLEERFEKRRAIA
jgi:hypothetical protein